MEKAVGPETKLVAEMIAGKIKLSVVYDGHQVDGGMYILSDSDMIVDVILALIPGNSALEQTVGMLLKTALKTVVV